MTPTDIDIQKLAGKAHMHRKVIRLVAADRGLDPEQTAAFESAGMVFVDAAKTAKANGDEPLVAIRQMLDGDEDVPGIAATIADQVIEEVGGEIGCRAGCSACCDMQVSALDVEVDRIAARVATMPEEQRRAILTRVQDAMDRGLPWLSTSDRFVLHSACPLLVDKRCSVYDERPIACRCWAGFSEERCSTKESSPFGLLTLIGDVAAYATWLAEGKARQGGDLIELLADRFGIKGRAQEDRGLLP